MNLDKIQENIEYKFKDIKLLRKALTHTSYAFEHNEESNEKLEFMGDAILEYITSEYIYKQYQYLKEGEMTKVRAAVVCESSLHKIALKHNFSDFLYLGKGELASNGKNRPAILADSVEAVIAAIYLDSGIEPVRKFIIENLSEAVELATKNVGMRDYKTVLQEKLQIHGEVKIEYEIINEEGPDHNKRFTSQVKFNKKVLAIGVGRSKKAAEMEAAKKALENIEG